MKNWTVNLVIVLALLVVGNWLHDQNTRSDRVLCTMRSDIAKRKAEDQKNVARSLEYLSDVRSGRRPPIKGITSQDILRGIQDRQKSIVARQDTLDAIDAELTCTHT